MQYPRSNSIDAFLQYFSSAPSLETLYQDFPIICAFLYEASRLSPFISFDHICQVKTDGFIFEGLHLPKDLTIVLNAFEIYKDSYLGLNLEEFHYERFLVKSDIGTMILDKNRVANLINFKVNMAPLPVIQFALQQSLLLVLFFLTNTKFLLASKQQNETLLYRVHRDPFSPIKLDLELRLD